MLTEEKARDSRGAWVGLVLALLLLSATLGAAFTIVPQDLFPLVKVGLGLGFALLFGALARLAWGRPLGGGAERVRLAKASNAGAGIAARRAFGFLLDAALVGGAAFAFMQVGDPWVPYDKWSAIDPVTHQSVQYVGLAALKILFAEVASGSPEQLGGLIVALLGFSAWLIPVFWLGATPGMLAMQLRWVRRNDGERIGALHALVRAVPVTLLFSPVVAFYSFFGHTRGRGPRFSLLALRTHLTDLIGRTFTMPS